MGEDRGDELTEIWQNWRGWKDLKIGGGSKQEMMEINLKWRECFCINFRGELPSGLQHCDKNWKFPSSNPTRHCGELRYTNLL